LVGFIALAASSFACAAILGIDEPTDRPADASIGETSLVDAGETSAPVDACSPPSCEGRCGAVTNECGTVQCGQVCDQGRVCDETSGQCSCPSLCGASTCGTIANACGDLVACGTGTCGAGESCRPPDGGAVDAGLSCKPGSCVDRPKEQVCAGACGPITTECGTPVTCSGCDENPADAGFCVESACACPAPDLTIRRVLSSLNVHCETVGQGDTPCSGEPNGIIGHIYSNLGDQDLYRCDLTTRYALSSNCAQSFPGSVKEAVKIGKCMSTPRCGAVPLRQFRRTSGVKDFYETTDAFENPSGYTYVTALCYIFP
jgi:hypothetical protein